MVNVKYIPNQTVTGSIMTYKQRFHKTLIINSTFLCIYNQCVWNSKAVLERIIPCQCLHVHISFHVFINITYVSYARSLLRTGMFLHIHGPNSTLLYIKPSVKCTDHAWYVIFAVYGKPRSVFDSPTRALLVETL